MDVEQYAWATEELVQEAEESVGGLEESSRFERQQLVLFFLPLAEVDPSGGYRIEPETLGFIRYEDGMLEWHCLSKDPAFANFEWECRKACTVFRDYLVRLLAYALAHGMDVARADESGSGRSILHALPHSQLHTDVENYDG